MEKEPVNFRQQRDFGEIFNSTFTFIGQEFKPLGKAIFYFVLPVLIVASILGVMVNIEQQKSLQVISAAGPDFVANPFSTLGTMYKYTFLTLLVYMVGLCAMRCTIYGYIKAYITKGKDQFTSEDVWVEIRRFILPVLGTSVVVGLLICMGTIFCIVPGIWVGVSLSLIYVALMLEGKGMGDAFNRSFDLIKHNWWVTFAIILIAYIIVYCLVLLLSVPTALMGMKSFFTAFKDLRNPVEMNFSTTFFIMSSITSLVSYLLFSIPFIAIAFQYFSLLEMKERPSLQDKIEQIG